VYYFLTGAIKRRIIEELRRYWSYHPKYPELPGHIQGKYSFRERPQQGIIVKTGSGTRVDLSADNYKGVQLSYVFMTKYQNYPGLALEWVREDGRAIQDNNGVFPSQPGVYYIELTEDNEYYIDPLLDVKNEVPTQVTTTEYRLQNAPLTGSLRLFESPGGYMLEPDINYTVDALGTITLMEAMGTGRSLLADYRYPDTTTGPHTIYENRTNTTVLPGVVLAFGRRNKKGDRMAIVVQDSRQPAALEYGGRWELTVDIDIMAKDIYEQEEIADQSVIYLWGIARNRMSSEGLEIKDVSMGGESEETFDENADDYYYNANFSMTVETEWSIFVPLILSIRRVAPLTVEQAQYVAGLSDDELRGVYGNIQTMDSLGLEAYEDPFFRDRSRNVEKIS
jgi:hypothetical protein